MLTYTEYCVEQKQAKGQSSNLCPVSNNYDIFVYYSYNNATNVKKLYRLEMNGKNGITDWNGWHSFIYMDSKILLVDIDGVIEDEYIC